jgi:S-formylglutathione hydrolase FrmB
MRRTVCTGQLPDGTVAEDGQATPGGEVAFSVKRSWAGAGLVALLAASCMVVGVLLPATAAPAQAAVQCAGCSAVLQSGDGITVLSETQADPRLLELQVTSAAVAGTLNVWVLLPTNYNASARYPVLYLLHGTGGTASDWVKSGKAEEASAGQPLIIVMPDVSLNDSGGSWCTNWVDQSSGAANWETFHIDELVPWVDANLPTVANRQGRAIAGLSMGGFCSTSYAARHPDLFETAVAYSGAPDIAYDPEAEAGAIAIINGTEVGLDHVAPDSIFGNPATDQLNWQAHDPATLAPNLADTNLLLYNGNGEPGPYDPSPASDPASLASNFGGEGIEWLIGQDNQLFHNRLDALGIPSYWDDYGPGTHTWPYWTHDFADSLPRIMQAFANPTLDPAKVSYTTADADFSVYGWSVSMQRAAEEFSTLEEADSSGFSLAGSGSGVVVTPAGYTPGSSHVVTVTESGGPGVVSTILADTSGRLHITVPLGPANPLQEYTVPVLGPNPVQPYSGPVPVGSNVYTTSVGID